MGRLIDGPEIVIHEWTSSDPASHPSGEHARTRAHVSAAVPFSRLHWREGFERSHYYARGRKMPDGRLLGPRCEERRVAALSHQWYH